MSAVLSKRERVLGALSGEDIDRVPVSAWWHLLPAEIRIEDLAAETIKNAITYDWDWVKVNPRASYFAEGWGSQFDFHDYHGVLPRFVKNPADPIDFGKLAKASFSNKVWTEHIELLRLVKKGVKDTPFVQTIFSPASVLGYLAGRPTDHAQAAAAQNHADTLLHLIRTEPAKAHHALEVISDSLAQLASASVEAGADGIFFAITKLARTGGLTEKEYDEFGKPYDFKVLKAVAGAKINVLHACGTDIYWDKFQDYPAHAINWAATAKGNPGLEAARKSSKLALIGGLDETGEIQRGTPADVRAAAADALKKGGKKKFLLSPGCCVEPDVPAANLRALRDAV